MLHGLFIEKQQSPRHLGASCKLTLSLPKVLVGIKG